MVTVRSQDASWWSTVDKKPTGCYEIAMARRDDVRSQIGKIDPNVLTVMDLIDRGVEKLGGADTVWVTLTDDMSPGRKNHGAHRKVS